MYPAFSFLSRECTPDNGQQSYMMENFNVPKGMPVFVPIYALHRDEAYFANPDIFDPERFSPDRISAIPKGAYLPFGYGPRQCLAERLSYIVMKVALFSVLRSHSIEKCPRTPKDIRPHNLATLVVPDQQIHIVLRMDKRCTGDN